MNATDLLTELRSPACFPHRPRDVQIVQTHLSIVCIAGDLVFKLKKALRLPFVDFSTLAARRGFCRDEVRLNRRLCPDVYLGCAALRRTHGQLTFAAIGDDERDDDLDVAVVMKRLPADRMLDVLVHERQVDRAAIESLARHVAAFHERADRGAATRAFGDPTRLVTFASANFTELAAITNHGLSPMLLERVANASRAAFATALPVLQRRCAEGRVVDGHGDLHARNVCMTDPPSVYDCIEFEPAFRCGDVATENAFLAMDLRYRGAPDLATTYVDAYTTASGDREMTAVLPPLVAYRAMVRAKVAVLAATESEIGPADREKARRSAQRHLLLAAAVLLEARRRRPHWLVVCGPPASGKTRLCSTVADGTQWPHVSTDVVRKELAGIAPNARGTEAIYSADFSRRTYAEVLARAAAATTRGSGIVLLDGNFPTPAHRADAARAARDAGATSCVVHVHVDSATALRRATARHADPQATSDAGPEQLASLQARFVAPTANEGTVPIRLDGANDSDELAAELLATLLDQDRAATITSDEGR